MSGFAYPYRVGGYVRSGHGDDESLPSGFGRQYLLVPFTQRHEMVSVLCATIPATREKYVVHSGNMTWKLSDHPQRDRAPPEI